MVKVALFITGQPRFVDSISSKYIKENIIDKYDCDVFCHTWFDENLIMSTAPWSGLKSFKCKGNEIEFIKTFYNPKVFTYDKPIKNEEIDLSHFKKIENPIVACNHVSMYTSMKNCFQNFLNVFNNNPPLYDVYIRCRYDLILTILPDLNNLEKDMTYFVNHHGDREAIANNIVITTSYDSIKKCMNVVDQLNTFGERGCKIIDEEIIYNLVKEFNIPHKKLSRNEFKDILPAELNFNIYLK